MRVLVRVMPVLLTALAGIYFYFYFKRAVGAAGVRTECGWVRAALAAASAVFVLPAFDIWGIWAVVVLYLLAFALIAELANAVLPRKVRKGRAWGRLYASGVLPAAALLLVLLYGRWNMRHVVEKSYTVYTEKPIRESGYRVALLTDLHFGTTMDAERLETYCSAISRERPDLVVLGGDLVDEHTTREELGEVFAILSRIRSAYGIYYVYGNHDRGLYSEAPDFTAEELDAAVSGAGITILKDESVTIGGELTVIGRDDRTHPECARRASSEALRAQADAEQFLLLVDHQPRDLEKNAALGYDLQLSGHTHGGQIWPVGLISDVLGFGEMNYGYRREGGFQVIVTSGMGGWNYALRTGKHSEYVIVDILPTAASRRESASAR